MSDNVKYNPAGISKKTGNPYPAKVSIVEKVDGVTINFCNEWKCGGLGVALSGAVKVENMARIAALVRQHAAEAEALLAVKPQSTFTPSSGFVADTAPAPVDPALVGVAVGTTGQLNGQSIRVTGTEGQYEVL